MPAPPPNATPTTAAVITSLPYVTTVDVGGSPTGAFTSACASNGPSCPVWYKYTPCATEFIFTINAENPTLGAIVSVWTGVPPALTELIISAFDLITICQQTDGGLWQEVPCTPGTDYYIQVNTTANGGASANLTLTIQPQQIAAGSAGDLAIPDDSDGFPAKIVSPTTKTIIRSVSCPAGESGHVLPDGTMCLQDGEANAAVAILNRNFVRTATVALPAGYSIPKLSITSNRGTKFYVITTNGTIYKVHRVTGGGGIEQTWTIGTAASVGAVARDDSILYFARGSAVGRYNLLTSTLLTDFDTVNPGGIDVDLSGNIWYSYVNAVTGVTHVRARDPSGTLLFDTIVFDNTFARRRSHIDVGDTGMWVWSTKFVPGTGTFACFKRVRFSDGSITASIPCCTVPEAGLSGASGVPHEPWAVSNSCPLLVLQQPLDVGIACGTCDLAMSLDCASGLVTISSAGGMTFTDQTEVALTDPAGNNVPFTQVSRTASMIVLAITIGPAGTYCATVTNPQAAPPPPPPPSGPPPPSTPPPSCPPLTAGAIPGLPGWFEASLIAHGATQCYSDAMLVAIEGDANANSMMIERGLACNIRARLIECVLNGPPFCSRPQCGNNYAGSINHNVERSGKWFWD